jgi:TetR/AcrR family transcriptional regulator, cholesterol catabolism regulator
MGIKDRIVEEAAKLFKAFGIKSVTMDQLAGQLGISKRTIYEVFSDKDELLTSVLGLIADRQRAMVARVLEGSESAIHAIFKLLESSRDHYQDMSPAFQSDLKKYHFQVLMSKTVNNEMPDYRVHIKLIERGIQERLFRNDINPDIVNRTLYSLGRSVMDFELYPLEEFSRKEIIKNVFINYLRGVSTEEGLELINKLEAKF